MKRPWHYLTKGDLLVMAALVLTGLLGLLGSLTASPGQQVVVSDGEQILYLGHLDRADTVSIKGPIGESRLVIDAQGAQIVAAPCPLKLCMSMGPAHRTGDLLACVPNRILVQIEGDAAETSRYDLLSR